MNLNTFIESQTERMKAFEDYWVNKIVPEMDDDERDFWDNKASLWDWVEQFEDSGI